MPRRGELWLPWPARFRLFALPNFYELRTTLSRARRNPQKVAIFLRHLCSMRAAEDYLHSFDHCLGRGLGRMQVSTLFDGFLSFRSHGYLTCKAVRWTCKLGWPLQSQGLDKQKCRSDKSSTPSPVQLVFRHSVRSAWITSTLAARAAGSSDAITAEARSTNAEANSGNTLGLLRSNR